MTEPPGLRRDIADTIEDRCADRADALRLADSILALPEIAQALTQAYGDREMHKYLGAMDGPTGIDTGPGSGNTPEDQRNDQR